MEMNETHRKLLKDEQPYLLRNLQPIILVPHLHTVLNEALRQEIEQEATTEKQVVKLLDILPRRGPRAFDEFIKALEGQQNFIADYLKKKETDKPCSRYIKMEEDLSLSKSEKEKLEKEVLEMNNKIKELSLHHEREKKNLQRCLENWKKELQETHERTAAETKKQFQEITTLQKENQELRSEIKQETHKISKLYTQVTRKKGALKKSHEGLEAKRKKGKKFKGKLEAVYKEKQKDKSCFHCEKLKEQLNLMKTEKENLELGKLNNSVKDKSKDYQRDIQTLQKELQSLKEGCENFLRELEVAANEHRQEGKKVLQA
ncbi:myosin heavy chain, clone 203-like [Montipora capricornis]|uniref:myosin heavy chain, clone 203-like n=1 Tax=Montipora capricornis TaxID=246305 RepID=UPI0035F109BC